MALFSSLDNQNSNSNFLSSKKAILKNQFYLTISWEFYTLLIYLFEVNVMAHAQNKYI
jgi:hypothetical protein